MNTSDTTQSVDFGKYTERTTGFKRAVDILNQATYSTADKPGIPASTMWILEMSR